MEKKTVLIIEDDRAIARLIEIVLGGKGLYTHVCLDATVALEVMKRVEPDLVILDIHMPRRSGISVLKRLRQEKDTRHVPVLVFSVLSRRQSIEQLASMGADAFISKSEGVDALVEKVLEMLA